MSKRPLLFMISFNCSDVFPFSREASWYTAASSSDGLGLLIEPITLLISLVRRLTVDADAWCEGTFDAVTFCNTSF